MTKKGNFQQLINDDRPVLIDFYADWCGPCKTLAPILKEVASKIKGQARIVKIDVDKNPRLAQQYQVRGIPTMMLFRSGKLLWRQSGLLSAHAILEVLNQAITK